MTEETQVRRVIGLDAHPYLFTVAALEGSGALQAEVKWIVDRQPLERLEAVLRKRATPGDVVVLEASGNTFSVAERIARLGLQVHVLESRSVGQVGKTYCATDKEDAVKIARVYLSGLAHRVWTPDAKAAQRRELFFAHRNAVCDASRARNRLWAWFNEHGVRRPKGLMLSKPGAKAHVLRMKDWSETQKLILEGMLEDLQQAEARRVRFRALIAEQVASDPDVLKLVRLLGVRHLIAFALAAFIGPIERFANPKKLVAYFGLNPSVNQSGNSGGTGRLSHCGRSDVRSLLIQGAQSILRYGQGATHRWAVALKMRKGATVAVAALARKLVVAVWYLLRGLFTPLSEIPDNLRTKIHKIATEIGSRRIRKLGFKDSLTFEEEKIGVLLKTT